MSLAEIIRDYKDSHLVLSLDHPARRPSSHDFHSKIRFLLGKRLRHWRETILRHAVSQKQTLWPLRSRGSSFLFFSVSAFFLSTRQMPALFDVAVTVSAFYVSRAVTPVIDLSVLTNRLSIVRGTIRIPDTFLFMQLMQKKRWDDRYYLSFDRMIVHSGL